LVNAFVGRSNSTEDSIVNAVVGDCDSEAASQLFSPTGSIAGVGGPKIRFNLRESEAQTTGKHAGWHRFTQTVVAAAGSFDAGSFQIPQRVMHLANAAALRDHLDGAGIGAEFVNHEKSDAAAATYLV
jgi:hypothetical protein